MKLLYCTNCGDIFNLNLKEKKCSCGKTKGKYNDNLNAIYDGEHAVPLGIGNSSFNQALILQPNDGMGEVFDAFVIPKICPTFIKDAQSKS